MGWCLGKQEQRDKRFKLLIKDMLNIKSRQNAVAAYFDLLDNVTSMTNIPPDGGRLRDTIADELQALYSDGDYKMVFANLRRNRPKDEGAKRDIAAVPLPLGDHYTTSLKQSIGNNVPRPELRFISAAMADFSAPNMSDAALNKTAKLFDISVLLQRLLVNKLKNGADYDSMNLLSRLQEEGMSYGCAGLRIGKWRPSKADAYQLTIDFVPFANILLSSSGRYLAIQLEVFKGGSDADEFKFKSKGFSEEGSDEESISYWELYDTDERKTYFLDIETCEEVKKAEDWPLGLDNPPIVLFTTGRCDKDSPYSRGLIERWLPIWEEIIIATSMLSHYSKKSGQSKLLVSAYIGNDSEEIDKLTSYEDEVVSLAALGMKGVMGEGESLSNHVVPFKPINSIAEWQNWLNELRRMLAEYQYFPDISRGVGGTQAAYMKAGTAQTIDQTRARLVGEVALSFGNMLERLYKQMLDYLGANTDIQDVREFLKDGETVALLREDMDISVSILDISATPEEQDAQKMGILMQGAPMLLQLTQVLEATAAKSGQQLDTMALQSDMFEKAFGLPLRKYLKPIAPTQPQAMGGMMNNGILPTSPPLSGGTTAPASAGAVVTSPDAGGVSDITAWFYQFLSSAGREYIIDSLADVRPEVVDALGMIVQRLSGSDARSVNSFLNEVESALDSADSNGELKALISRYNTR